MTITSTQKLISIGSSEGVTLPKKELAKLGATRGDELKVTVELVRKHESPNQAELMREYDEFVKQYGETLKNLSER